MIFGGFFRCKIRTKVDQHVEKATLDGASITAKEIEDILESAISDAYDQLVAFDERVSAIESDSNALIDQYWESNPDSLNQEILDVFSGLPLSQNSMNLLEEMPALLLSKNVDLPLKSGLVIAGFGEKEAFPVVRAYDVYGRIEDTVVCGIDHRGYCEIGTNAVIPYAQRDVAETFLLGVDPNDLEEIRVYLGQVFSRLPKIIVEHVAGSEEEMARLAEKLNSATQAALETFGTSVQNYLNKRHTRPLLDVLDALPKFDFRTHAASAIRYSRGLSNL